MTIRSLYDFRQALDGDWAWRKHEIASINLWIKADEKDSPDLQIRLRHAHVALYAHWEGFFKTCCKAFIELYDSLEQPISKVHSGLVAFSLLDLMQSVSAGKKAYPVVELIDEIRSGTKSITLDPTKIKTGKLDAAALHGWLRVVGIDATDITVPNDLIDNVLVATRNIIAHGSKKPVERNEYLDLATNVEELLETIKSRFLQHAEQTLRSVRQTQ
ncbi:MAG: hypothetical protein F9K24_00090 [Leptonema illini]|uniref:MAE-28990/MAE-18760-like HEPN domain-containing protein n=1 Tax=Leptonema illini TaxID=183 RepID=A0A833H4Z6_9LEPT|nr:MAG: hypothetical protein F9K24_00090 [Leptonema illini]